MAAFFRHSGTALLLFPLLVCKWCCTYWSYVHSLPVSGKCIGHSSSLCGNGPLIPLQSHGWAHTLWHWVCTGVLRCQLCPASKMVGLRIHSLCRQYHYLARNWGFLVENHWPVVKRTPEFLLRIHRRHCQYHLSCSVFHWLVAKKASEIFFAYCISLPRVFGMLRNLGFLFPAFNKMTYLWCKKVLLELKFHGYWTVHNFSFNPAKFL